MNRIPQDSGAREETREVVQVTLNGPEEICAATALACIGVAFLGFAHAARTDQHEAAQLCLQHAGELAGKVFDNLPADAIRRVHALYHAGAGQGN